MNSLKALYYPELDGLRFFAFLLVYIHHTDLFADIPIFSILHELGWIGVDLFFVLSAFLFTKLLLTEYHISKKISFKKFYLRRIFRIWPIYFLFIGFSVLISVINGQFYDIKMIQERLASMFLFSDNIFAAIYGYNPLPFISHLWTICYEEQFYIFIPLFIYFLAKWKKQVRIKFLVSILIVFTLTRNIFIYLQISHPAIWVLPITHFESILFGIFIGFSDLLILNFRIKSTFYSISSIILLFCLLLLPDIYQTSYYLNLTYIGVGLITSFFFISVFKEGTLKKFFSKRLLVYLGKRSYGLYVYHVFAIKLSSILLSKISFVSNSNLISFLLGLIITIIISIISYRLIEKPFLIIKRKFEVVHSRPI